MLITVDVGSTLGTFTGPPGIEILTAITARHHGVKPSMVGEVKRWFLHVAPVLTEELISEVCDYLLIPRTAWPQTWAGGFTPYPYAADVLATLSQRDDVHRIVALSNISIADGPARMADLDNHLGTWLDDIVPSYTIGTRKPHRRCWETIATRHGITVADIIHIGDRIPEDIHGALHAGCRGAILTNTRHVDVPNHLRTHPHVAVVDDLRGIEPVLAAWDPPTTCTEPAAPHLDCPGQDFRRADGGPDDPLRSAHGAAGGDGHHDRGGVGRSRWISPGYPVESGCRPVNGVAAIRACPVDLGGVFR